MTEEEVREARDRMSATGRCPQCDKKAFEYPEHVQSALDGQRWAYAPHKKGCPIAL